MFKLTRVPERLHTPTARAIAAGGTNTWPASSSGWHARSRARLDRPALARRVNWRKVLFVLALLLFIFAPSSSRAGPRPWCPSCATAWPCRTLRWLWLAVRLRGAVGLAGGGHALTLFDAARHRRRGHLHDRRQPPLGAAFIVLAIGFVYTVRGHERQGSLAMGLLSFIITAAIYLPGLAVGYWLLQGRAFDRLRVGEIAVVEIIDVLYAPLVGLAEANLPLAGLRR